jgi:hypothetical protein
MSGLWVVQPLRPSTLTPALSREREREQGKDSLSPAGGEGRGEGA